MPPNDLNDPLRDRTGASRSAPGRQRRPVVAPMLIAAGLVIAVIAGFWIAVVDDPDGGQAVAIASIKDPSTEPATTGSIAARPAGTDGGTPVQTAALPGRAGARVPRRTASRLRLIELSAFGPLPRIGADGQRPREAYSRRGRAGGRRCAAADRDRRRRARA